LSGVSRYLSCAGREIHFMMWGQERAPTVIAWHGLARTGRDMDELAAHLSQRYRVICPDTIGRGLSQWSPAPKEEYCLRFYARIARDLFDQLGVSAANPAHWVGTSMGGAIGTVCASGLFEPSMRNRIRSLVLNDTAPQVADAAVARIRAYAGAPPAFSTMAELEAFFRQAYQPFGWLSDAQWRRLTETSTRRLPDGRVTPHYDPAMVGQFEHHPDDYAIWPHYDALEIPVLSLCGEFSDLVLPDTIEQMRRRGPGALGRLECVSVAGCGHAPALNVPEQLERVAAFLQALA
jgi:pimeloyl-ACP methyl ester carboxylesterase